ncbi:hypothetical protein [Myxosarcina sp. GI1(2024)]
MVQSLPSNNIVPILSKKEQVKRFLSENESEGLLEVSEEETRAFINEYLKPRLRYNLLTQEVEFDGISLQRHENETLSVEQRLLVVCEEERGVIFKKQQSFKRHLLDVIGYVK